MRRRTFLGASAAILATPLHSIDAFADEPTKLPVIGFLGSPTPGSATTLVTAFRHGLEEMGYIEGQNVAIDYRWAEGRFEQLPALVADLVGRKVDVIAADAVTSARAAKDATPKIPVVFISGGPVEACGQLRPARRQPDRRRYHGD
jgi:putative tryptophan/tyrosine transport system substrate-binding protein